MNIHEGVGWGRGNTLRKNFRSYIFLESRALADHRLGKRARARCVCLCVSRSRIEGTVARHHGDNLHLLSCQVRRERKKEPVTIADAVK